MLNFGRPIVKCTPKGGQKKTPTPKTKMIRQYKCADGSVINISELTAKFDTSKFTLDQKTDLIYFVNTDNFETLCVPDVKDSSRGDWGGSGAPHNFPNTMETAAP